MKTLGLLVLCFFVPIAEIVSYIAKKYDLETRICKFFAWLIGRTDENEED